MLIIQWAATDRRAPRGTEEIIKILARTDTAVLSKSKTCIYKSQPMHLLRQEQRAPWR